MASFATTAVGNRAGPVEPEVSVAETTTPGTPAAAENQPQGLALRPWAAVSFAPEPVDTGLWRFESFDCVPTAPRSGTTPEAVRLVTLTTEQPAYDCTAVYRLDPGTLVVLTKNATGDPARRAGDAELRLTCTDGDQRSLVLPENDQSATSEDDPLPVYNNDVSCTVTEIDNGASSDATVNSQAQVTPGGVTAALPLTFDIDRTVDRYDITVTNQYTPATPSPSPTPTPTPTPSPTPTPIPTPSRTPTPTHTEPPAAGGGHQPDTTAPQSGLASTGGPPIAIALLGLALLASGVLVVRHDRRRHDHGPHRN